MIDLLAKNLIEWIIWYANQLLNIVNSMVDFVSVGCV